MPLVRIDHGVLPQVDHRNHARHVEVASTIQEKHVGDSGEDAGWGGPSFARNRSKHCSRVGHEDGRRYALPGHVGQDHAHPLVAQREEVVVVTSDLP